MMALSYQRGPSHFPTAASAARRALHPPTTDTSHLLFELDGFAEVVDKVNEYYEKNDGRPYPELTPAQSEILEIYYGLPHQHGYSEFIVRDHQGREIDDPLIIDLVNRTALLSYSRRFAGPSMAAAMSPSASPRLPSPPPIPEVQIGPQSPRSNNASSVAHPDLGNATSSAIRIADRIRPGTSAADIAAGPPLVSLGDIDSPYALQTYIKALWHHHTAGPEKTTQPMTRETAQEMANPPPGVDRALWLYEICRLLVQKVNEIVVAFFTDRPPCTAETCPEMRASEWQYLCAVHDPPKSCCAIDYCCHTLDWAAAVLTSHKHFPSRLTLGSEPGGRQAAERHITNIFRRVYRIFAHAWFQHRQIFWNVEGKWGHYVLFKAVCDAYALIPAENYTIPPEAEGLVTSASEEHSMAPEAIMKRSPGGEEQTGEENDATTTISTGATTRRHKHTPSTGSAVTVIQEDEEDEPESSGVKEKAPPVQKRSNTELRDPHEEDDDNVKEVGEKPAEESLEKAVEDFTISEPMMEKEEGAGTETEAIKKNSDTPEDHEKEKTEL